MRSILARKSLRAAWRAASWPGIALLLSEFFLIIFPSAAGAQIKAPATSAVSAKRLTFNQTIQPILSENCYPCHGPDPGARKAKLRLDRGEFAFAPHDKSGPAIIPGQPDKSPLVRKFEAKNP
jgi:hypothetical protein